VVPVNTTVRPDLDDSPPTRRWSVGKVLAILVVVAIAGFWVYAFSPLAPDTKADGLADRSFVDRANERCKASMAQLNALPRAMDASTPVERAVVVDQANQIVATMVQGLRDDAASASGRDRELLDQWFDDWDTYVANRERFADELRANDASAAFTVPARNGGQITETMDGFSRTNRIIECLVPLDV
jgi:hypothetical protein